MDGHADCRYEVHHIPPTVALVGVNTAGHSEEAKEMLRQEGDMEADGEEAEVPETELIVRHLAKGFRIPVVDSCENCEQQPADQNVMEVGHDEIRVAELPGEWRHSQHDARETGDEELEEEANTKNERQLKAKFAAIHGGKPVEDFDARGNGNKERRGDEKGIGQRDHAHAEHMVRPDAQADKGDRHHGGHHDRVAENGFAGENWNHLRGDGKGRHDEDVNFGMAENPKEMLPQHGITTRLGIEEFCAEVAVQRNHDLAGRETRQGKDHQKRQHDHTPDENRQATKRHSGAAHAENGDEDIESRGHAADAAEQERKRPVIRAVSARKGLGSERRISKPPSVGR